MIDTQNREGSHNVQGRNPDRKEQALDWNHIAILFLKIIKAVQSQENYKATYFTNVDTKIFASKYQKNQSSIKYTQI